MRSTPTCSRKWQPSRHRVHARRIHFSRLFGGNSNWRGPVWMPVNYLLVELIYEFHRYYGDDFQVECPVGSGRKLTLREIADELSRRLGRLVPARGRRPASGARRHRFSRRSGISRQRAVLRIFPWRAGRGVGASHQTGWTGLIALLLHPRGVSDPCSLDLAARLDDGLPEARGT